MTRFASKLLLVILTAATVFPALAGCGIGTTQQENNRTIARVWDADARMMTDDLGLLVLARRPFWGSRIPLK